MDTACNSAYPLTLGDPWGLSVANGSMRAQDIFPGVPKASHTENQYQAFEPDTSVHSVGGEGKRGQAAREEAYTALGDVRAPSCNRNVPAIANSP